MTLLVRPARADDAAAIAAIYAPYVVETVVTFEEVAPDAEEMERRIASSLLWLVAEVEGAIVGYAYARPFHPRAAYRWTCETSVYLARTERGGGVGRRLYTTLLNELAAHGFVAAIALLTVPNPESERFHAALGFGPVGRLADVGWKHGAWHDVSYYQRDLAPRHEPPAGTPALSAG